MRTLETPDPSSAKGLFLGLVVWELGGWRAFLAAGASLFLGAGALVMGFAGICLVACGGARRATLTGARGGALTGACWVAVTGAREVAAVFAPIFAAATHAPAFAPTARVATLITAAIVVATTVTVTATIAFVAIAAALVVMTAADVVGIRKTWDYSVRLRLWVYNVRLEFFLLNFSGVYASMNTTEPITVIIIGDTRTLIRALSLCDLEVDVYYDSVVLYFKSVCAIRPEQVIRAAATPLTGEGEEAFLLRPHLAQLKRAAGGDLRFKVGCHVFGDPLTFRDAFAFMDLYPRHRFEVNRLWRTGG
ncbi:unnamed protein product [Clonostachys rosea]|uniref:Uncharacterized protein n=1 Tax=Bionectria ochroleuca TaxID=29856 RepID=A0ABY6UIT9_BIOOC|nr:unnamed protein product [Clonostachys rosea]